jgi:hypothetical protein
VKRKMEWMSHATRPARFSITITVGGTIRSEPEFTAIKPPPPSPSPLQLKLSCISSFDPPNSSSS